MIALVMLVMVLGAPVAMGAVCAPRGNLCTPAGAHNNNPTECCVPGDVCPASGPNQNHCTPGPPTTTTVPGPTTTTTTLPPTAACRPEAIDISLARNRIVQMQDFHGVTATASERDCLESATETAVMNLLARFADVLGYAGNRARDKMSLVYAHIQAITPYRFRLYTESGDVWAPPPAGADYSRPTDALTLIREQLTNASVRPLVKERLTAADRILLDIGADGVSKAGLHIPDVPYVQAIAGSFPVDTRHDFLPCATGDCSLLGAVEEAHLCTVDHPVDECPDVLAAHEAYESQCEDDADCRWFRRIAFFSTFVDPRWSAQEVHWWRELTEVFHARWSAAQRAGDTKESDKNSQQHNKMHMCLAIGHEALPLVVVAEDGLAPAQVSTSYGGAQSCVTLLPHLVAAYHFLEVEQSQVDVARSALAREVAPEDVDAQLPVTYRFYPLERHDHCGPDDGFPFREIDNGSVSIVAHWGDTPATDAMCVGSWPCNTEWLPQTVSFGSGTLGITQDWQQPAIRSWRFVSTWNTCCGARAITANTRSIHSAGTSS